jgi:hypothetical protein
VYSDQPLRPRYYLANVESCLSAVFNQTGYQNVSRLLRYPDKVVNDTSGGAVGRRRFRRAQCVTRYGKLWKTDDFRFLFGRLNSEDPDTPKVCIYFARRRAHTYGGHLQVIHQEPLSENLKKNKPNLPR